MELQGTQAGEHKALGLNPSMCEVTQPLISKIHGLVSF